jgi:hypothetical protein
MIIAMDKKEDEAQVEHLIRLRAEGVGVSNLSPETREWMDVMVSLRALLCSVALEELNRIGLSGLPEALDELAQAGLTRTWGDSAGIYVDLLWL